MKTEKKIWKRVVAGVAALLLLALLGLAANDLLGNPVSLNSAEKQAGKYLSEHYSHLNVQIEKVIYNFKFKQYEAKVISPSSKDTVFWLAFKNGRLEYDSYESEVVGGFQTVRRLEEEYTSKLNKEIAEAAGLAGVNDLSLNVRLETEEPWDHLTYDLDEPLNTSKLPNATLTVSGKIAEKSLESAASAMKSLHEQVKAKGYQMAWYDAYLSHDNWTIQMSRVKAEQIEGGDLVALLKQAIDREQEELRRLMSKDAINEKDKNFDYTQGQMAVSIIEHTK